MTATRPSPQRPAYEPQAYGGDPQPRASAGTPGFLAVLAPLVEGWKLILLAAVAAGVIAVSVVLLIPRRYDASVELLAIANPRMPSLGGGLAASLLGGAMANFGLQPTPALVVRFAGFDGVLREVAMSPAPPGDGHATTVIERMARKPIASIPPNRIMRTMRKHVHASFDKPTGVITVRVTHRDSALARVVAGRVVDAASVAFVHAVRSQATLLREAQELRVDSAAARLARAEAARLRFMQANRVVGEFSIASVDMERHRREVDLARTVYDQATADREGALAKELEETPTVVVVDALPEVLPVRSRHTIAIAIIASFAAALIAVLVLLSRDAMRRRLAAGDPDATRIAQTISPSRAGAR